MKSVKDLQQAMKNHIITGLVCRLVHERPIWEAAEAAEAADVEAFNAAISAAHYRLVALSKHDLDTKPHKSAEGHWYGWVREAEEFVASEPPLFHQS